MQKQNSKPSRIIPFIRDFLTLLLILILSALSAAIISFPLGLWAIKDSNSFTWVMLALLIVLFLVLPLRRFVIGRKTEKFHN